MKPNAQVQYIDGTGRLTIAGLRLLEQLDAQSRTRVTLPGFTTAERNALDAAQGQIIYNTTTGKLNFYTGSAWEAVTSV
jgi:hypothetical protein